jgi:hypothetical protein
MKKNIIFWNDLKNKKELIKIDNNLGIINQKIKEKNHLIIKNE